MWFIVLSEIHLHAKSMSIFLYTLKKTHIYFKDIHSLQCDRKLNSYTLKSLVSNNFVSKKCRKKVTLLGLSFHHQGSGIHKK